MQRIGGVLLLIAGVSLGAYTFIPPPNDSEQTLREVTRISAAPDRSGMQGSEALATGAVASNPTAERAAPVETGAISKPSSTWSAIVTTDPAAHGRLTSSKPADDETRVQLTRDLQSQLKRVGCYAGEITGNWSPSTRRAMSDFMDRVNATLPTDEPDYILLTLVQGHAAQACGATCPAGQGIEGGRCVPQAVLSRTARKEAKEVERRRVAEEQQKAREAQAERQVAEAAATQRAGELQKKRDAKRAQDQKIREQENRLRAAAAAEAVRQTRDQTRDTQVAAATPQKQEKLPWLDETAAAQFPQRPGSRPDGMMSIGGPRIVVAELPPAAAAVTPDPGPRPQIAVTPGSEDGDLRPAKAAPKASHGASAKRTLKSGPVAVRPAKKKVVAQRWAPPPVVKPQKYFFAGNAPKYRRDYPRPGSPAYNMLQAMGGVF